MIHEMLMTGRENAIPGRQLAAALDMDIRTFTKQVERERQSGAPVCAVTTGEDKGYFLAADAEDLEQYCRSLDRRLRNLQKTRLAVGNTLERMSGQERVEGW